MSEQRFVDIETKVAHQEVAIEDLEKVVLDQQKLIDVLSAKLEKIVSKLKDESGGGFSSQPGGEKPPHY